MVKMIKNKFYSPLRYPGGKNRLSKFISQICTDNKINDHYVEPFCGGASVGLYLLLENKFKKITLNDLDKSIYSFWYCVLNKTDELCTLIHDTEISIENWKKQKEIQKEIQNFSSLEVGFSTLFLNRANFSGILKGGPIGGLKQKGKYKLNCRFNKDTIIKKIKLIARYKEQITLHNLDVLELIDKIQKEEKNKQTIFYFDPPYFNKGKDLYLNFYKQDQHKILSEKIKNIKKFSWIVSYDDKEEINENFSWVKNRKPFILKHFANKTKNGKEILFFKDSLKVNSISH